jgi:hypothetical protein
MDKKEIFLEAWYGTSFLARTESNLNKISFLDFCFCFVFWYFFKVVF